MARNTKVSSAETAALASKLLKSQSSSDIQKKLSASVLAQALRGKETGKEMEGIASDVLKSDKYSDETRALAASLVSQSEKNR
jgi:hypothetical protein